MQQISRRQFLASTAAVGVASAVPTLIAFPGTALAAAPTVIRAETRIIDVFGRPATVLGLVQPGGAHGLVTLAGQSFLVRLENALDAPTLIHWHGLTPPFGQDGVPDLPQPLLQPGESYDYGFPLETPGTHWMHAHTLQEQQLLAAPLIVTDPAEAGLDEQAVVVLFHDFSFKTPEELLAGLTGATAGLRLINGATATAFWIDTGVLEGEAIAVDGNAIIPVCGRRFALGMGRRIDIRIRLPQQEGAWPILALREGARQRTGFFLATQGGAVKRISSMGETAAGPLDLDLEANFRAVQPLRNRSDPVFLGGTMENYAWTLNGKAWGSHQLLPGRSSWSCATTA